MFEQTDPANNVLTEVAFYDTGSAWSVYPFFESGTIVVGDIVNGLVIARLDLFDGDFNFDGALDCNDIDGLIAAIASGTNGSAFDVNGDGDVNLLDRDAWLAEAGAQNLTSQASYLLGDANLDGSVDGEDFLVWNTHKFGSTGAWCEADFNGDGVTSGEDFLIWNANKFQSADHSAVPEPATHATWFSCIGALVLVTRRRSDTVPVVGRQ